MGDWRESSLSEIADIIMGQSPKGEFCNSEGNGTPLLNGPTEFGIKFPTPVQYTTEAKKTSNINDILFCVRGSTTGRMNWADLEYAIGRGLASIRHKKGEQYRYFIKGILDFNLPNLLSSATGSTFPNVSRSQLEELKISIPPLDEQKAIAEVLSSLDDKIDLLHHQNKTLEAMAQTLFRQWLVEEADEGWEIGTIEDIMDLNPTHKLKKGDLINYLEMGNVQTDSSSVADWYKREFTSGTKFKNGDTVLARITPSLENGKTAYIDFLEDNEIGWGSTEFIVMRMKENYHPFISYLIAKNQDFRDFAIGNMTGSTGRQRAQAKDLKEYEISLPPQDIIDQLNDAIKDIPIKIRANAKQIKTLENMRDILLPKLMSGEVRVKV